MLSVILAAEEALRRLAEDLLLDIHLIADAVYAEEANGGSPA